MWEPVVIMGLLTGRSEVPGGARPGDFCVEKVNSLSRKKLLLPLHYL